MRNTGVADAVFSGIVGKSFKPCAHDPPTAKAFPFAIAKNRCEQKATNQEDVAANQPSLEIPIPQAEPNPGDVQTIGWNDC